MSCTTIKLTVILRNRQKNVSHNVSLKEVLNAIDLVILSTMGLDGLHNLEEKLNNAVGAILAHTNQLRSNEESKKDGCLIGQLETEEGNHG